MFKFGQSKQEQVPQFPKARHSYSFGGDKKVPAPTINIQSKHAKQQLPADFAEKILNLEIEIELNEDVKMDAITSLIHLYMQGVEYYEIMQDRKKIYFERKLNQIIQKPAVQLLSTSPTKVDNTDPLFERKKKDFQDQQKKLQIDLMYGDQESQEAIVGQLVQSHTNAAKQIEVFIEQNKTQQDDSFKKRLESRKKGMTRQSSLPFLEVSQFTPQLKEEAVQSIIEVDEEEKEKGKKLQEIQLIQKLKPIEVLRKRVSLVISLQLNHLQRKTKNNKRRPLSQDDKQDGEKQNLDDLKKFNTKLITEQ